MIFTGQDVFRDSIFNGLIRCVSKHSETNTANLLGLAFNCCLLFPAQVRNKTGCVLKGGLSKTGA